MDYYNLKFYVTRVAYSPTSPKLSVTSLQYNVTQLPITLQLNSSVLSLDFAYISSFAKDVALFRLTDSQVNSDLNVDLQAVVSVEGTTISLGPVDLEVRMTKYPNKVNVSAVYDVIFAFPGCYVYYSATFLVAVKDASGNNNNPGWTFLANQNNFDYGFAGATYTNALAAIANFPARTISKFTYTTTLDSNTDSPLQPMKVEITMAQSQGGTLNATETRDLRSIVRQFTLTGPNVREGTNVPYKVKIGLSEFWYNILIKPTSFTVTVIPLPVPVPTPTPTPIPTADPMPVSIASDEYLGLNAEEIEEELANMTPSTRAAARRKLYENAVDEKFEVGELSAEQHDRLEKRNLFGSRKIDKLNYAGDGTTVQIDYKDGDPVLTTVDQLNYHLSTSGWFGRSPADDIRYLEKRGIKYQGEPGSQIMDYLQQEENKKQQHHQSSEYVEARKIPAHETSSWLGVQQDQFQAFTNQYVPGLNWLASKAGDHINEIPHPQILSITEVEQVAEKSHQKDIVPPKTMHMTPSLGHTTFGNYATYAKFDPEISQVDTSSVPATEEDLKPVYSNRDAPSFTETLRGDLQEVSRINHPPVLDLYDDAKEELKVNTGHSRSEFTPMDDAFDHHRHRQLQKRRQLYHPNQL